MRLWTTSILALMLVANRGHSQERSVPDKAGLQGVVRKDIPGHVVTTIDGFTVVCTDETWKQLDDPTFERSPKDVLESELKTISTLFRPQMVQVLRRLPIWVQWDRRQPLGNGREGFATAVYKQSAGRGDHPLQQKTITILRMKGLAAEHQPGKQRGRSVLLHEVSHAVHDQIVGIDNGEIVAAYRQAMARKLYDKSVYASTNSREFFAELSCAYFDQLVYFPKTRAELEKHDPETFKVMKKVWESQR